MKTDSHVTETQAFSERLRQALESAGVRPSPTVVAKEFNQRHSGKNITSHTARKWLFGVSIPMHDKVITLADWLQVSPEELRFGVVATPPSALQGCLDASELTPHHREMLKRYLELPAADRKTVREVVAALFVASKVKDSR